MAKTKSFTSVRDEEHVISEAQGRRSREQVLIDSALAETLLPGTVLGKVTATGRYLPLNPAAADGTETAATVANHREEVRDPVAHIRTSAMARDCELNGNKMFWPEGITDAQKKAAEAQLALQDIIVRY